MFPAGSVSTSQNPFHGPALDVAWHPFTAKLALLPGVTTVPVCFHGQNSRLFHMASHVHYALRVALLFRETLRRSGSRMSVSVGEPVTAAELAAIGPREAVVAELRRRTLGLQGSTSQRPKRHSAGPTISVLTEFLCPSAQAGVRAHSWNLQSMPCSKAENAQSVLSSIMANAA